MDSFKILLNGLQKPLDAAMTGGVASSRKKPSSSRSSVMKKSFSVRKTDKRDRGDGPRVAFHYMPAMPAIPESRKMDSFDDELADMFGKKVFVTKRVKTATKKSSSTKKSSRRKPTAKFTKRPKGSKSAKKPTAKKPSPPKTIDEMLDDIVSKMSSIKVGRPTSSKAKKFKKDTMSVDAIRFSDRKRTSVSRFSPGKASAAQKSIKKSKVSKSSKA